MDENKEVNTTDPKREKVRVIPLSAIDDAPDHPFGVRDDEEMAELVESISTFGVINPVIVRKGEGDRYELISGHRRKYVECVDESGKILKTQKYTGNGTLWSFEPPEVDGYTTTCASITRDDITNWRYPASHYVREANGSIRVVYSPIGS